MTHTPFSLAVLFVCELALGHTAQGATLIAPGLAPGHVQQTVDATADGDIVVLPAGTVTWTTNVAIAYGL